MLHTSGLKSQVNIYRAVACCFGHLVACRTHACTATHGKMRVATAETNDQIHAYRSNYLFCFFHQDNVMYIYLFCGRGKKLLALLPAVLAIFYSV
jgi:hypothetical protein